MTIPQTTKPVVAAFDFDGTLTRHDTLLPFLLHTAGAFVFIIKTIQLLPIFTAYAFGLMRNNVAKEKVLGCFLAQMELNKLQQHADQFARTKLPTLLRKEAIQKLEWHQQQGHRCIVISASLENYLQPWANTMGITDVLGSRLKHTGDGLRVTGKLDGENCFGPEKMRRLEALLGQRDGYILYTYGDSRGDKELLSAADYPFYKSFTRQGLQP